MEKNEMVVSVDDFVRITECMPLADYYMFMALPIGQRVEIALEILANEKKGTG